MKLVPVSLQIYLVPAVSGEPGPSSGRENELVYSLDLKASGSRGGNAAYSLRCCSLAGNQASLRSRLSRARLLGSWIALPQFAYCLEGAWVAVDSEPLREGGCAPCACPAPAHESTQELRPSYCHTESVCGAQSLLTRNWQK